MYVVERKSSGNSKVQCACINNGLNPQRQLLHMYSTCDKLSDSILVLSPPPISRHFSRGTNVGG